MFKKYRWFIVFMLFLGGVINYLDRSAFSVAAPTITKELHLNSAELGIIFSSFSVGYALFNFVGGYLSDVYGPKKVFTVSMAIWSIFCGLTITAFSFASLFIIRMLFGLGEGPLGSTTNKTIGNWIPPKERARAVGFAFSGNPLGGAIAGPIVGLIAVYWSWKVSFILITLIGLVWAYFWNKTVTDQPHQHAKVTKEELEEIEQVGPVHSGTNAAQKKLSFSFFIKQPAILFTAFAFFGYNYILYFFLNWFPSYLSMDKGLSIKDMSIATVIPWIVGSIGLIASGYISDYIFRKTDNALFSRKVLLVIGLICSAICIGFTGMVATVVSAVTLMTLGIFFMYITATSYWAILADSVTSEVLGGVTGFVHGLANLSGIVAPSLTGFIVLYTGKFTSAFLVAGALAILGALSVAFFVKPIPFKKGEVGSPLDIAAK
jgi:MFS transporter, ACS family, hexuronate transporter